MRKIIRRMSQAVQLLLAAPIRLPGKAMNIMRYVAVGLGILEAAVGEDTDAGQVVEKTENGTQKRYEDQ